MSVKAVADYTWKDVLRIGLGLIMFVLGILGLVLPILQGVLFLLISLVLLAPYSRTVRRGLAWMRLKFPGVHARARAWRQRMVARFNALR